MKVEELRQMELSQLRALFNVNALMMAIKATVIEDVDEEIKMRAKNILTIDEIITEKLLEGEKVCQM